VLLAVFLGYLISLRPTTVLAFCLISGFAIVSKLFAITFADGRNFSRKKSIYSATALVSSVLILSRLSYFEIVIGVIILAVYLLYPFCNGRTPFDAMHHALRYVFLFVLGFGSQAFWNETALATLSAIVLFSVVGELLTGLQKESNSTKSTASVLGIKRSLVAIISLVFIASLITSFAMNNLFEFPVQLYGMFVPFYVIPALVLDLFLTVPLLRKLNAKHVDAFHSIRRKEVVAIIVMSLSVLVLFQAGRAGMTVTVNSQDYSFTVHGRTIIAGRNSWDVPWIVFDYENEDNYYYVVFHTDGVLELSERIQGQYRRYVSWCQTTLTPFDWNSFQIALNQTTVTVRLDGKYQLNSSRQLIAETSSIIISGSTPNQKGPLWVAAEYSIAIVNATNSLD